MEIVLAPSDKKNEWIYNFSPYLSIVSAREHVALADTSVETLTAYNLILNAVLLFKLCKMETSSDLSSVDSSF